MLYGIRAVFCLRLILPHCWLKQYFSGCSTIYSVNYEGFHCSWWDTNCSQPFKRFKNCSLYSFWEDIYPIVGSFLILMHRPVSVCNWTSKKDLLKAFQISLDTYFCSPVLCNENSRWLGIFIFLTLSLT